MLFFKGASFTHSKPEFHLTIVEIFPRDTEAIGILKAMIAKDYSTARQGPWPRMRLASGWVSAKGFCCIDSRPDSNRLLLSILKNELLIKRTFSFSWIEGF